MGERCNHIADYRQPPPDGRGGIYHDAGGERWSLGKQELSGTRNAHAGVATNTNFMEALVTPPYPVRGIQTVIQMEGAISIL